ncbi:MAG: gamma-glutamyl-gamma-aminobutyrate hydrolase family protein [Ktedonobacterales bacterium]
MTPPLIGIPAFATIRSGSGRAIYANNQSYARAVAQAGGVPLFIPPTPERTADDAAIAALCARLDGLLLSGGADMDPAHYGQQPTPFCEPPEPERDALELALTRHALMSGLPMLGICRGMQALNIACGGTLYQDIAAEQPEAQRHPWSDHPRDYRAHSIRIAPNTRLAAILGVERHEVNSLHHQAVAQPGAGVIITAWADDGIAEALELPAHPFALAVQYHPEELVASDPLSRRLFAAFIAACQEYARLS